MLLVLLSLTEFVLEKVIKTDLSLETVSYGL